MGSIHLLWKMNYRVYYVRDKTYKHFNVANTGFLKWNIFTYIYIIIYVYVSQKLQLNNAID